MKARKRLGQWFSDIDTQPKKAGVIIPPPTTVSADALQALITKLPELEVQFREEFKARHPSGRLLDKPEPFKSHGDVLKHIDALGEAASMSSNAGIAKPQFRL